MKRIGLSLSVLALSFISGCATSPDSLPTASVSSLPYSHYNCGQIGMELDRVSSRIDILHASLKKKADNDAAQMAVGMLIFWPTLFFLEGGDGPDASEYSRLKGEQVALQQMAVRKECTTAIAASKPAATAPQTAPEPAAANPEPLAAAAPAGNMPQAQAAAEPVETTTETQVATNAEDAAPAPKAEPDGALNWERSERPARRN